MSFPLPALPQQPPQAAPVLFSPLTVSREQKMELLEYWRSITKRKWAILALTLVVAVLAGITSFALTPVYRSTAEILIESGKVKTLASIDDVYTTSSQEREYYQTQVEILKSREVAERTALDLKLWNDPEFDPRKVAPSWRARAMAAVGLGTVKTHWTDEELLASATMQLMGRLTVEPVRLSQLVKVSIESTDPKEAATLANALAAQYIDADRDSRFKLSQQVSTFLQDRLSALRDKLQSSEQSLQTYREQKGIVNLGGSAQVAVGAQVSQTSDRLVTARSRRLELESTYQQAKTTAPEKYAQIPAVMRDPVIVETLKSLSAADVALHSLQQTLGPQNSAVQRAQSEYNDLKRLLAQQSAAVVAGLKNEYEAARGTELALQQSLGAAQGGVQTVNREEFQLSVLERDVASNRQLYEMFMSRAKETNLAGDVQAAVGRVVDRAVAPTVPVRPARVQIVVVACVLALFIGAMASLLMDRLDNTVKGGDDAEVRLHQSVLAALPMVETADRPHMVRNFLDDPHSHYAEGIRTARTGVLLSSLDVEHKILLITSALPNEGKTTVAVNMALAHAQTKRTLLIDADMRRSQAGRSLGMMQGQKGLTNLVAGNASADECCYPVTDSKLMVMPVGDMPPNPLELLLSQRFKDVLKALSDDFEMIVIDSPPVELVSEALVLAPLVTNVAFVVKAMTTPAPLARKSIARLQRAGGNILGVIVNQLDFKHAQQYYGEYGAASYSYGGYGAGTYGAPTIAATDKRERPVADEVG